MNENGSKKRWNKRLNRLWNWNSQIRQIYHLNWCNGSIYFLLINACCSMKSSNPIRFLVDNAVVINFKSILKSSIHNYIFGNMRYASLVSDCCVYVSVYYVAFWVISLSKAFSRQHRTDKGGSSCSLQPNKYLLLLQRK